MELLHLPGQLMDSIRFILDGELVEVGAVEPTRTLLQYLREDLRRVGSKEGCAEGDCGACTVVVAELDGEQLSYRAVNACIQFLPTVDGKALFTVESLKAADGGLHPVQQSMVDFHGSQCGFCTPGFVMSMFALYQQDKNPQRALIDDALGLDASVNTLLETHYLETIKAMVKTGLGWSMLPQSMLDESLTALDIKHVHTTRQLGTVVHSMRTKSNAANAMINLLMKFSD